MGQKPQKSSFKLQAGVPDEATFPTVSLTTDPESTTLSEEDKAVRDDKDTSRKFQILNRQGLNPLKPVMIANTEFLPIGEGTSPDSTGLKVELGENNIISVNAVTKLVELHRQIRLATLKSAHDVLSNAKGYNISTILEDLEEIVERELETVARPTMDETVNELIKRIKNGLNSKISGAGGKANRKNRKSQKSSATRDAKGNRGKVAIKKGTLVASPLKKRGLVDFVTKRSNDPFFRTLVEYAIIENVLYTAVRYLSGILAITDIAERNWSILEAARNTTLEKLSSRSMDRRVASILEKVGVMTYGAHGASMPADEVFDHVFGIGITGSTNDVALIVQCFLLANDTLRLRDGYTKGLGGHGGSDFSLMGSDTRQFTTGAHVYNSLRELSMMSVAGMYYDMSVNGNVAEVSGAVQNATILDRLEALDKKYDVNKLSDVLSHFPSDFEDSEIFSELLAAVIFNDSLALAPVGRAQIELNSSVAAIGAPSSFTSVKDLYRALLGSELDSGFRSFQNGEESMPDYVYDILDNQQGAPLIDFLSAKRSGGDSDLPPYIPLESTNKNTGASSKAFMTGPEFFFNVALQRGDETFKDFQTYLNTYKSFTQKYARNVVNLTDIFKIEDSFRELCRMIGEELEEAQRSSTAFFMIALIAISAQDDQDLLDSFVSTYFGSKLNVKKGKSAGNVGGNVEMDPFIKINGSSKQEARRRVMRIANTKIMRKLLLRQLNIQQRKLKTKSNRSIKELDGDNVPDAIKPKEYVERDGDFDKVRTRTALNSGTSIKIRDQGDEGDISYVIWKQSGDEFGTPNNGLNKELTALEGGLTISNAHATSFKSFMRNEHLRDAGIISDDQLDSFNDSRSDLDLALNRDARDAVEYTPKDRINAQGGEFLLGEHQRLFVLFGFLANIIKKSIRVEAKSHQPDGSNNAHVHIYGSKNELKGLAQAFVDFADRKRLSISTANEISNNEGKQAFLDAYDTVYKELQGCSHKISRRAKRASSLALIPALHGMQLQAQLDSVKDYIRNGDGSARARLAIELLKNKKVSAFSKTLDLLSEEAVSSMYRNHVDTIMKARKFSYTNEDYPRQRAMKLMIKILTNSGYGFLETEKRGPKTACHIGITNSLLRSLRFEAFKEMKEKKFLDSKRFCINIFKRNELDSQVMVYPKTFLFDSSLQIIDSNHLGKTAEHIKSYSDSWTAADIANNIQFTRWTNQSDAVSEDPFQNIQRSYAAVFEKGSELKSKGFPEELIMNHLNDYALKQYYKFTLGIDLNEYTFDLDSRDTLEEIPGGLISAGDELKEDYDTLINQLIQLYPAANVDQVLSSELFRAIRIIAQHPVYNLTNKVKRALYPKKFDRVISTLINEKDFVLYTPVYDKEFSDIFETTPNFSYTSKITRPEIKTNIMGERFNTNKYLSVPGQSSVSKKYKSSCHEDFPEVFSLYATITILLPESK